MFFVLDVTWRWEAMETELARLEQRVSQLEERLNNQGDYIRRRVEALDHAVGVLWHWQETLAAAMQAPLQAFLQFLVGTAHSPPPLPRDVEENIG